MQLPGHDHPAEPLIVCVEWDSRHILLDPGSVEVFGEFKRNPEDTAGVSRFLCQVWPVCSQ